jgi:hypothetical protein
MIHQPEEVTPISRVDLRDLHTAVVKIQTPTVGIGLGRYQLAD